MDRQIITKGDFTHEYYRVYCKTFQVNYNINMARKYTSRRTKRTRIKVSPKEAEEIIRQEVMDSRGNKFIFRVTGNPHKPQNPTIQGTVEYHDGNNDN